MVMVDDDDGCGMMVKVMRLWDDDEKEEWMENLENDEEEEDEAVERSGEIWKICFSKKNKNLENFCLEMDLRWSSSPPVHHFLFFRFLIYIFFNLISMNWWILLGLLICGFIFLGLLICGLKNKVEDMNY